MSRLINAGDQQNLWGATSEQGLEPQRTDLWKVDLTEVVCGLNFQNAFRELGLVQVSQFMPQFVQSVTLPETRLKPEVVRRDSVAYQMPGWDDPLDPLKVIFLLDTYEEANQSKVLSVLQAWHALARAGRGTRTGLYTGGGQLLLNENFRYDYTFNLSVALLRGNVASGTRMVADEAIVRLNQQMMLQADQQKALDDNAAQIMSSHTHLTREQLQAGGYLNTSAPPSPLPVMKSVSADYASLIKTAEWQFNRVWLGGWKLGDLSYTESKLLTVEATLYAESFEAI